MKTFLKIMLGLGALLLALGLVQANNIRIVGKPVLADKDSANGTVNIKFDIAWDNSWMTSKPDNHDAAWIFVKCWDGESWQHVYLEESGWVAGKKKTGDGVNKDLAYYVSDREGKKTDLDMTLVPGYSLAWKKWHIDPKEEAVKCVVGFFLKRVSYGVGHVVIPGVSLKWDYESQGFVAEDDLVVKVFAIEMVYVPEGPYYLGGKGTSGNYQNCYTTNGTTFGTPMLVTSEKPIKMQNSTDPNTLWVSNANSHSSYTVAGDIPEMFPKGYQAFYIMKYELTQQAYCEFLNTLNQGQQDQRIYAVGKLDVMPVGQSFYNDLYTGVIRRMSIHIKQAAPLVIFGCDGNKNGKFDEVDTIVYGGRRMVRNIDGQDLAMHSISMSDLMAYAEFAGLRPMTDLEYEKACRGPREPANNEFAWGNNIYKMFYVTSYTHVLTPSNYTKPVFNTKCGFTDHLKGTERVGDAYNFGATRQVWWRSSSSWGYCYPGTLRVGVFADSTSSRVASGATYWGVMNMSDNAAELVINAASDFGRKFQGVHGCGQLDENGECITAEWNKNEHYSYAGSLGALFHQWESGTYCRNEDSWNGIGENTSIGPGSNWGWHFQAAYTSNRYVIGNSSYATSTKYLYWPVGIRCVRTANAER